MATKKELLLKKKGLLEKRKTLLESKDKKKVDKANIGATIGTAVAGIPGAQIGRRAGAFLQGGKSPTGFPEEQAGFGLLRTLLPKSALPQPTTPQEKIGSAVGGIAGTVGLGVGGAGLASKAIKGTGAGASAARGAIGLGAAGAIQSPETSFGDLQARAKNAVIGVIVGGAAGGIAGTSKAIKGAVNDKAIVATEKRLIKDFFQVKQDAVNKFAGQLDDLAANNPGNKGVSLKGLIDDIARTGDDAVFSEQASNALKRVPGIKKLVSNPNLADDLTVRESQDIINFINTKIPKNIKFNNFEILDARNTVRAAQLDAFPEMAKVRAEYGKVLGPINQLKGQFQEGKLFNAIKRGFKSSSDREKLKAILPKGAREAKDIKRTTDAIKTVQKGGKQVLRLLLLGAAAGAVGGKIIGRGRGQD